MEPVFEYLKQEVGLAVLAWLIIFAILAFIVWKAGQRYALYKHKADNLPCENHENTLKELSSAVVKMGNNPCVRHDMEIKKVDEEIRKVDVSIGKVEAKIEGIYEMVRMIAGSSQSSKLTQSHSPISLTTLGKEISQKLNFADLLNANWDKIETIIENERNPYDIQMEFIAKFITDTDKYLDEDSIDRIKKDAYLRGFPLIDYMRVLGVMARDKYFSIHNIDVSEVDKNDPNLE